jgi:GDPmannose 4,6-dehydratase
MKKALITGISGQDGSYLAELLLSKGYEVHGIVRRESIEDYSGKLYKIASIKDQVTLHTASLNDPLSIYKLLSRIQPEEIYHLAASTFVSYNFDDESHILETNFNVTHSLLASIKEVAPECHFFFAGSSEMFGNVDSTPQDISTYFRPRSIYGLSKLASYHLLRNYRDQYGLFACTGILYNHESPRRDFKFVTRKITSTVAKIKLGLEQKLYLGTLDSLRDWGYAPDYVYAMWLMLNNESPKDYVIASGITHSVRDFVECAFNHVGLNYQEFVELDPKFYRPPEAVALCGDSSEIQADLQWQNTKTFQEVVAIMVEHDLTYFSQIYQ